MLSEESRTIPLASSQAPQLSQQTSDLTVPFESSGESTIPVAPPTMLTGPSTIPVDFALDAMVQAVSPASGQTVLPRTESDAHGYQIGLDRFLAETRQGIPVGAGQAEERLGKI